MSLLQKLVDREVPFSDAKQMAIENKALKKNKSKLEPIKETLVNTTGLDFNIIASKDINIEEKLLKCVDNHDPARKPIRGI